MIRLLCDGCTPKLYWGEEALAVNISKKLSYVAMHDPQNAKKINDWVFERRDYFRLSFNSRCVYPFIDDPRRHYNVNAIWFAPRDRMGLDVKNDYRWDWSSPGHELIATIGATIKKCMHYDAYKEASSDEQNRLEREIARRLWEQVKPYAEIRMDHQWSPAAYDPETMGSAHGIPVIEVVWGQIDQETIDQAFLNLENSDIVSEYISTPLTCELSL